MQLAGETTGMAIAPIVIQNPEELDTAFSAMVRERPGAIVVLADGLFQRSGRMCNGRFLDDLILERRDRQERLG
jgi:hypothetical protein